MSQYLVTFHFATDTRAERIVREADKPLEALALATIDDEKLRKWTEFGPEFYIQIRVTK